MNDDPLNIEHTEEEKEEANKYGKVYLIMVLFFIGFTIPIMIVSIYGLRVANDRGAYPNFLYPLIISLLIILIIGFFVSLILLNRYCKNKYGFSILEMSPFYQPSDNEPTNEDDKFDKTYIGEKEIKKKARNEFITTIFMSLIIAVIGIVIFFFGNDNPGDKLWVGYTLLGIFCFLSLLGIISSIIRYIKRLNKIKAIDDEL
ncbi:MAG: hypothetical protein ACTSSK_12415 [Candidatus Heimdallarchaeota archaeon]